MKDSKNELSSSNFKKTQCRPVSPFQTLTQHQNQYISSQRLTYEYNQNQNNLNACLTHSSAFTNICFTCNFLLLCPCCLKDGLHKNHDFRTLQKSFFYIKNNLKQCIIKLQSKFNLFSHLTEQLFQCKTSIYHQAQEYKLSIQEHFEFLKKQIQQKQLQIVSKIDLLKEKHEQQIENTINNIKKHQKFNIQCQKDIVQIVNCQNQKKLHQFFTKNKVNVESIIDEKTIRQLQQKIYQISWRLDFQQFQNISQRVKNLQLTYRTKHLNSPLLVKPSESSCKKLNKYKSQTYFKNKIDITESKNTKKIKENQMENTSKVIKYRHQKQRDSNKSYGNLCMTPKQNCSRQKNEMKKNNQQFIAIKKRKKSSGKNISMPVSPIKQQKQPISTSSFNADAMKKKKTKKNV